MMQFRLFVPYLFHAGVILVIFPVVPIGQAVGYRLQILRATEYLRIDQKRIDGDTLITLDILSRNYGLKINTSVARENFLKNPQGHFHIWLRSLDRKYIISELEVRAQKLWPGLMAAALYCDIYPLPWDFLDRVRKVSSGGGYGVVRAIFALAIADWQHCPHEILAFEQEKNRLVREIPEIIQRSAEGNDLWVECILALYFSGNRDWVTADLKNALARKQLANGSWNDSSRTTAKALWIFLEAGRRGHSKGGIDLQLLP